MTRNEWTSRAIGNNPAALRKRILEAKASLKREYRDKFKPGKWDIPHKRLWSDDGDYCLKWQLRDSPLEPESYENQQTSIGTVVLCERR